jgi:hypothetical protein
MEKNKEKRERKGVKEREERERDLRETLSCGFFP